MKMRATLPSLGLGLVLGLGSTIVPIASAQSFQKNFGIFVNPPPPTVTNISCGSAGPTITVNVPVGQTALVPGTVMCPLGVTMSDGSVYTAHLATMDCTGLGSGCVTGARFVLSSAVMPSNLVVGPIAVAPGNYFVQLQTVP